MLHQKTTPWFMAMEIIYVHNLIRLPQGLHVLVSRIIYEIFKHVFAFGFLPYKDSAKLTSFERTTFSYKLQVDGVGKLVKLSLFSCLKSFGISSHILSTTSDGASESLGASKELATLLLSHHR